jgi:hypothetical protein
MRMDEGNENVPGSLQEKFSVPQKLTHGTSGFTSHPKEGVLRFCTALKNQSHCLAFGSSGKHNNQYTNEGDLPVGDRERLYCVAQQCQINCLRFRSYSSCLFSSI